MSEPTPAQVFLETLTPRLPEMLSALRRFVVAESPSLEKIPADRCCAIIASEWRKRGVSVQRLPQKHHGDQLRISWHHGKARPSGQLLVLGHYDTVYSSGTLAKMPFRIAKGKAYGPGTFDMKAGIVQALFALQALQKSHHPPRKKIVFLWTADEEIGSARASAKPKSSFMAAPLTPASLPSKASTPFMNCRANSHAFRSGTIFPAASP
jgi:glutamate carboxypeptidase